MKTIHLVYEVALVRPPAPKKGETAIPPYDPPTYTCLPCKKAFGKEHCEFCGPMGLGQMPHANCHTVDA